MSDVGGVAPPPAPGDVVAVGRTAEVVVADVPGRVVKLDRPGWEGLAAYEGGVLARLHAAGLPVPRPFGEVRVGGQSGLEMEHLLGPTLGAVLEGAPPNDAHLLAGRFSDLLRDLHGASVEGLPALVPRLRDEVGRSGLPGPVVDELAGLLGDRAGEPVGLCHGDLHPDNVVVTPDGWRVVDWVNVSVGPLGAEVARAVVLLRRSRAPWTVAFGAAFEARFRGDGPGGAGWLDGWVRVVAAARLAEGPFPDDEQVLLRGLALRAADGWPSPELTAADAVELLDLLEGGGLDVRVDGGWGVDALVGRPTRPHGDLDVVVGTDQVPLLWDVLGAAGFVHTPAADDRPWNFVVTDGRGRRIDVHAVTLDPAGAALYGPPGTTEVGWPAGTLDGSGVIAGRPVRCTTAAQQVASRAGYPLRPVDHADLQVLRPLT